MKQKNIKIGELVIAWDKDRSGEVDSAEFATHVREMGLKATDRELQELFEMLDDDGSGSLDLEELKAALRKLLSIAGSATQQKAADKVATAAVQKAKKLAEAAQKVAHEAMKESEARYAAAEEAAKEAEADREAAAKKAAASKKASKLEFAAKLEKERLASLSFNATRKAGIEA